MLARLAALVFATALAASAQATVHGFVRDAADSSPIPGAQVFAIAGEPRAIVAETTADAQGRYRLEATEDRFELTADALGYFVARAGDVDAETVARVCPASGDCGQTDFTLARAAVFDGWITDKYGNPMQSIEISLTPSSQPGEPTSRPLVYPDRQRNRNTRTASDDRGYFRFWGLRPGSYRIASRVRQHYPGIPDPPALDQTIEIPAGEESVRMSFQLTEPPPAFTISGELEGVDPGDKRWITLEPLAGGERQIVYVDSGKFSHPAPAGEYVARLEQVVNADMAEHQSDYLATLTIDRDIEGLRLRPQPPTGVRARAVFVDAPPAPFRLMLRSKDRPTSQPREIQFAAGETEIERHGFLPGDYTCGIRSQGYYLIERPEVTVVPGQLTEVELRLSNLRSTVRGKARFAAAGGKSEAAHVTVGIRGRNTLSVQTDNEGGFLFEKLIPGEYEIAAWARPEVDVKSDEVWEEAGERVRRIVVEPGFEVEVDLTIAP